VRNPRTTSILSSYSPARPRLLTRKILTPIITNPLLATNVYDEVRAGYCNIGRLTTSTNAADVQRMDYSAAGTLQRRISGAHTSFTALSANESVLTSCIIRAL
jgi:YD repeat-containing protein